MEDKIRVSLSPDYKTYSNLKKTFTNQLKSYLELQNKIKILQMSKNRKIKLLENSLSQHRKSIQTKINKQLLKDQLFQTKENQFKQTNNSELRFQALRQSRSDNIQLSRSILKNSKQNQYNSMKNEHKCIHNYVNEERNKSIETKINKKNNIKMIQQKNKQSVASYWDQRVKKLREIKLALLQNQYNRKLPKLKKIHHLQNQKLMYDKEMNKLEDIQDQIKQLINKQQHQKTQSLIKIYKK